MYSNIFILRILPINYSSTNHNYHKLIATIDNKQILLFYEFESESFYFAG
jgi:hypothetical protein